MIRCLIVDDEPLARSLLEQYLLRTPHLSLIDSCSSSLHAIQVLRSNKVDIMFLDVQMPELTGINLLKIIDKPPYVILTTAYSEYALEGYELDIADYLLKPITFERFLKSVEKVTNRISADTATTPATDPNIPSFIFVKDGTKLIKIRLSEILFVEGMKDYVAIHTTKQRIISLQRLKVIEAQLPDNQFIRIHHSFIISVDAIDSIHKEKVQIGKHLLPISDSYKATFKAFVERNHLQ